MGAQKLPLVSMSDGDHIKLILVSIVQFQMAGNVNHSGKHVSGDDYIK